MDAKRIAAALWDSFGSEQSPHDDVVAITEALEAAYRAGIEAAARVVEITGDVPVVKLGRIMDRIRALAPGNHV